MGGKGDETTEGHKRAINGGRGHECERRCQKVENRE